MTNVRAATSCGDLDAEMKDLASRDLQLWSIGVLILIVLAMAVVALVLPNLMWKSAPVMIDVKLLPQLFSGFIVLVILFNAYLINQKRQLNTVRDTLIKRLILNSARSESPIDSLTSVLGREAVSDALAREKSRADRNSSPVSIAIVDIAGFRALNKKFGNLAGDHALLVVAQMLKATFRGSDTVARFGGDEFIVIMPDTDRVQAQHALGRLTHALENWNATTDFQYKLAFNTGIGSYATGCDIDRVVAEASERACVGHAGSTTTVDLARRWFRSSDSAAS
jgi:diguanylate cyclase (GGDEF)-like protein